MNAVGAAFKALFLLTSVSSAVGYGFAKALHTSNGPTKKIANFSVFMAYSFVLYLFACLGSSFFCAASGERCSALLLFSLFCLPFALAFFVRSYDRAQAAFDLQILGLVLGAAAFVCLDRGVRQALFSAR